MFSALFMVSGTLVADVMLFALDPRMRNEERTAIKASILLTLSRSYIWSCSLPVFSPIRSSHTRPGVSLRAADAFAFF